MFQHRLEDQVSRKTYIDWFILSFLAGNINTGGFLASHRFVSHVTGYATLAGISFAEMNWYSFIMTLIVPTSFLLGVMFSAYLTQNKFVNYKHGQKYAPVMQIVSFLLLFVSIAGYFGFFGEFGGSNNPFQKDYLLSGILCMACGLQNGAITMSSGATVRTTHLTGLTTDLGLGLVRLFSANTTEQKTKERRSNLLRIGTVASFIFGAVVGAVLYINLKFAGFLLPTIIAYYFAREARTTSNN